MAKPVLNYRRHAPRRPRRRSPFSRWQRFQKPVVWTQADVSRRFFEPYFHGEMEAWGVMNVDIDADIDADIGAVSDLPARRFRTYIGIHVTADGVMHINTRRGAIRSDR